MSARANGVAPRLPFGRTQAAYAVYYSRRARARLDNPEVKGARVLLSALRESPPDVLYLGDSTTSFVSATDVDRRRLYRMIGDSLGDGVTMHTLHGGSYNPALFNEFLRLAAASPHRPVVVLPLCIRVRTLPWIEHPIFGHKQATRYLTSVAQGTPAWRVRAGFPRPTAAQFAEFYQLPHPTWAGELTVGDYIQTLKNAKAAGLSEADRVRLLYAYHHGGRIEAGTEHLAAVSALGATLRGLGCEFFAYQTPVPVQTGTELYGPEFDELARHNFGLLQEAFLAGAGEQASVLQTGLDFTAEEFIDPQDASEHLNQQGRARLAELIATQVTERLANRRSSVS
jgi:hypothetical protein